MRLDVVEPAVMECLPNAHAWRAVAFDFRDATIAYRCVRCRAMKTEITGPTAKAKERRRKR